MAFAHRRRTRGLTGQEHHTRRNSTPTEEDQRTTVGSLKSSHTIPNLLFLAPVLVAGRPLPDGCEDYGPLPAPPTYRRNRESQNPQHTKTNVKIRKAQAASLDAVSFSDSKNRLVVVQDSGYYQNLRSGVRQRAVAYVLQSCMSEIASRELRNNTRGLLQRVAGGEDIIITVDGHPVAALRPLNLRPHWMSGVDFARRLTGRQADPGLRAELQVLSPDTTDDVPL